MTAHVGGCMTARGRSHDSACGQSHDSVWAAGIKQPCPALWWGRGPRWGCSKGRAVRRPAHHLSYARILLWGACTVRGTCKC